MNIFYIINPLLEYNLDLDLTQVKKRRKSLGSSPVFRYIDGNKTGGVMSPLNVLSTQQAAEEKGCSRQAILDAITRGVIDGQRVGREFIVQPNRKFREWHPSPMRQEFGRKSQKRRRGPKESSQ